MILNIIQAILLRAELAKVCFVFYAGIVMSTIPPGAFAVAKVRQNFMRKEMIDSEDKCNTPHKYNSKLMNSIWGLYNRYSVHNFKKNTDAELKSTQGTAMASQMFV